jgi:hypothetical protein
MAQPAGALLALLRDVGARVAIIVCELELGETAMAYLVASDLERDLDVALGDDVPLEEAA